MRIEDQIVNHRLLLEVGIHSGRKGGNDASPTTKPTIEEAESDPSETKNEIEVEEKTMESFIILFSCFIISFFCL